MTVSPRRNIREGRRSHRSLAKKLTWHRGSYEVRQAIRSVDPSPEPSWVDQEVVDVQGIPSTGASYHVIISHNAWSSDVLDILDRQFRLLTPSLADAEVYQHYSRIYHKLYAEVFHTIESDVHDLWAMTRVAWPRDQEEREPQATKDVISEVLEQRDPFWDPVPTDQLIAEHKSVPVRDVLDLKLDIPDSDEEREAFMRDIDEARRTDTI